MTLVSSLRFTLASLAMLSSFATAQIRFCLGGNLQALSEAEQTGCKSQLQALRATANALPQGSDWHVVLVCGERAWQDYQSFSGISNTGSAAAMYDVDLLHHEIFLRSSQSLAASPSQTLTLLRQVAASETKALQVGVGE